MRPWAAVRASARRTVFGFRQAQRTICAALLLGGLVACGGGEEEVAETGEAPEVTPEEQNAADARAAINASARVLAAISRGDSALMREAFVPTAMIIANGPDGAADTTNVDQNVQMVAEFAGRFEERIWNPSIELSPEGARVSAAYDFYTDGEFSHCGVDIFTVVPFEGDLKVEHLEYTVAQPPECELHPAGPPGGG